MKTTVRPSSQHARRAVLLGTVVCASSLVAACARPHALPAGDRGLNVLVITLDTIRVDRLGAYGNTRVRTDFVDGLAEHGVLFEHCVSPTPLTLPAHTSIFTGTYPVFHGVRDNGNYVVPKELTTMAELFSEAGYRTGAFVGAFVLSARWGLDQGFQTYSEPEGGFDPTAVSFDQIQRPADAVVDDAIAWLQTESEKPFYAWVHLYDPHLPYDPPPDYVQEYLEDPYSGEVAFADAQLYRLQTFLEERGLDSRTMIIFAGDHGEGLGDHGELDHGLLLYQTTIRVPLVVFLPGIKARTVRRGEVVSLVDILPTVVEATGLPLPAKTQGRSLWPLLSGSGVFEETPVYAESYYPRLHFGWSPLTALQNRRYQFVQSSEPELYDLERDPAQQHNIFESSPEIAERMSRELASVVGRLEREGMQTATPPDAATIAKLAALGYVTSGAGAYDQSGEEHLASPRSMLRVYNRLIEANNAVSAGDAITGEEALREIVVAQPSLVDGWISLGRLYRSQGRTVEALTAFREAHQRRPLDPFLVSRLTDLLIATGKFEDAQELLLAARERHPNDPAIAFNMARLLESTGRFELAESTFRTVLALDPRSAPAHVRLAALALRQGNSATANDELEVALRLEPRVPDGHLLKGQLFEHEERFHEAEQAYRVELSIAPDNLPAALALSRLEGRLGRPDKQDQVLRQAILANPRSPAPYLMLALTFLQREERYAEAVELAHLALEREPTGRELRLNYLLLADLYNRLGDSKREAEYARLGASVLDDGGAGG